MRPTVREGLEFSSNNNFVFVYLEITGRSVTSAQLFDLFVAFYATFM